MAALAMALSLQAQTENLTFESLSGWHYSMPIPGNNYKLTDAAQWSGVYFTQRTDIKADDVSKVGFEYTDAQPVSGSDSFFNLIVTSSDGTDTFSDFVAVDGSQKSGSVECSLSDGHAGKTITELLLQSQASGSGITVVRAWLETKSGEQVALTDPKSPGWGVTVGGGSAPFEVSFLGLWGGPVVQTADGNNVSYTYGSGDVYTYKFSFGEPVPEGVTICLIGDVENKNFELSGLTEYELTINDEAVAVGAGTNNISRMDIFCGADNDGDGEYLTPKVVKLLSMTRTKGSTTTVSRVEAAASGDAAIYNLSGQRVSSPRHGIYVKGGKKYVAR